jgi:hypothetical protein
VSGEVYERNKKLVTRVYQLGCNVLRRNEPLAERLMGSIMPLLRYEKGLLSKLSEKELRHMRCIKDNDVGLVYRVLQGESILAIAKGIPALPKEVPLQDLAEAPPDIGSGIFENVIRELEGGRE